MQNLQSELSEETGNLPLSHNLQVVSLGAPHEVEYLPNAQLSHTLELWA
jgi:hypothetical protein